jgi:hypothetical protein
MQASPASLVKANFSLLGLHEYLPFSQFDDILNFSSEDIVCLANGCRRSGAKPVKGIPTHPS